MKRLLLLLAFTAFSTFTVASSFTVAEMDMKNPQIFSSKIITGGQPSKEDLEKLKQQGIDTVINLRGTEEFTDYNEKEEAEKLGLKYISLPINGGAGVTLEATQKFNEILKINQGNLFIHCASGNRVGALMALNAHFYENKSKEESLIIGKKSGLTRLKTKVEKMIDSKN